MAASMQSVLTRGFGIAGGFAGDVYLVPTAGYGIGDPVVTVNVYDLPAGTWQRLAAADGTWRRYALPDGTWDDQ